MNHYPQAWGRVRVPCLPSAFQAHIQQPRDDVYGAYDHSYLQNSQPTKHTQSPAVTGTSVIGVKFKDGVVLATDNLGMSIPCLIMK